MRRETKVIVGAEQLYCAHGSIPKLLLLDSLTALRRLLRLVCDPGLQNISFYLHLQGGSEEFETFTALQCSLIENPDADEF
jgi:hypothetical protein